MLQLETGLISVLWISVAAVVYSYGAYPLLLWCLSRLFGSATEPSAAAPAVPSVSLLVAAHDEEMVIEGRIRNALELEYPRDRLEIVIASDGSSDNTASIVRRYAPQGVRLLDYSPRRGKASVLNRAMQTLTGEIVVLSDANTHTDASAVARLVRWFVDPAVGVVCGRLVITDPVSGRNADGLYWKYETFLKKQEGRLGALLGSNGAIYAIRRDLFQPIPDNTIIDDFVIPLVAKQRAGCRVIYDSEAVAHEEAAPDVATEFRRRARIGAGGFQAIGMLWRLLNPARGWIAFTFLSHKIMRWLCPFFLVLALLTNLLLVRLPAYRLLLCIQLLFYSVAAAGGRWPASAPAAKAFRLAHMFVRMNLALLVGFFRWLSGPQTGMWRRTERGTEGHEVLAAPAAQQVSTPVQI